jgi:hypothetical protein
MGTTSFPVLKPADPRAVCGVAVGAQRTLPLRPSHR